MNEEIKADFFYECHKCKASIAGHWDTNGSDLIVMVKDSKPNTYLFECDKCNEISEAELILLNVDATLNPLSTAIDKARNEALQLLEKCNEIH